MVPGDVKAAYKALCAMLRDPQAVEEFGCLGGHKLLVAAVAASASAAADGDGDGEGDGDGDDASNDDDEVAQLASQAVALCVDNAPPGVGFPLSRRCVSPVYPDEFRFPVHGGLEGKPEGTGTTPGDAVAHVTVFIEQPPAHVRMKSQDDVGLVVWPVAVAMARFFLHTTMRARVAGKHVLELGCGPGATGLAVAPFAASTILSDFNRLVLQSTARNVQVTMTGLGPLTRAPPATSRAVDDDDCSLAYNVGVCRLDWADDVPFADVVAAASLPNPDLLADRDGFDVVFGSDVVCRESDVVLLVGVVDRFLAESGTFYLAAPPARSRFGASTVKPVFEAAGFFVRSVALMELPLSAPPCVPDASHAADTTYLSDSVLHVITRAGADAHVGAGAGAGTGVAVRLDSDDSSQMHKLPHG